MKTTGFVLAMVLSATSPALSGGLAAQDVAARLDRRVPADVASAVQDIARDATARGLPVEPLIQKAIEGGAKGVPSDRVIAAVRLVAARLDEVQGALRDAGIAAPSSEAIERGADALNAGLNADQVRDLGRVSRPPYDPALTLHVAAALVALEVPPEQGLQVMKHMIQAGRRPNELLDLPSELQVAMARGASAAEAVDELDAPRGNHGGQGEEGQQGAQGQQEQGEEGRSPHTP